MLRIFALLGVYFFYSQTVFAQQNCTVFYQDFSPFLEATPTNVQLLKTDLFFESSPEAFRGLLNDSSLVVSFKNLSLQLSLTNNSLTPNSQTWVPVTLTFETADDLMQKLNCNSIRNLIAEGKDARAQSLDLQHILFSEGPQASIGESILKFEASYASIAKGTTLNIDDALFKYQALLEKARQIRQSGSSERFFMDWRALMSILYSENNEGINYCAARTLMTDALLNGCTNCIGETSLILSLFTDAQFAAPKDWKLSIQVFNQHIRPILFNPVSKQVFDLTYGRFDEDGEEASIFYWRDVFKFLLNGFTSFTHPLEQERINNHSVDYSYTEPACGLFAFDLGYSTRIQVYNFTGVRSCGTFTDAPQPEDGAVISNEGRLNFTRTDSGATVFFQNVINQLFSKEPEEKSLALYKLIKDLYLQEDVLPNLASSETDLLQEDGLINETIDHFKIENLMNLFGIAKGLIPAHDVYFESPDFMGATQLPLIPFIVKHDSSQGPLISVTSDFSGKGRLFLTVATVSELSFFNELLALSTPERYILILKTLEETIGQNISILARAFDSENLEAALLFQSKNKGSINLLLQDISAYKSLFSNLFFMLRDIRLQNSMSYSSLFEYSYLFQNAFYIQKISTYSEFINKNPLMFLNALSSASEKQALLTPENPLSPFSKTNTSIYWLPELLQALKIEAPYNFAKSFYSGFVDFILFNSKYFFTAEANEDELQKISFRPYNPLKLESLPLSSRDHSAVDLELPTIEGTTPCESNEVGYVPRGLFYIFCEGGGLLTSATASFKNRDGFANGLDDVDQEGLALEGPYASALSPQEDVTQVDPQNRRSSTLSDESLLKDLIDPRQEVIISRKVWESLAPILNTERADLKNLYALHHMQRESIADLIAPDSGSTTYLSLYSNIEGGISIFAPSLAQSASLFEVDDLLYSIQNLLRDSPSNDGPLNDLKIAPNFLNDNLYSKIMYLEAVQNTKPGWTLKSPTQWLNFFNKGHIFVLRARGESTRETLLRIKVYLD